jgi:lysophospholipase
MKTDLSKYLLENGQTAFKKSKDGRKIRTAIWRTQKKKAYGTVFFLNGHREFIEKYSDTFEFFVKKGFNIITLDWRGWGLSERPFPSRPKVQHISSAMEYQLDVDNVISLAKEKSLATPWHLVAHSLGCLIGLRRLISEPLCFEKYIFLSPLWGSFPNVPRPIQRFAIKCEKAIRFLGLIMLTEQSPKKYIPYSLTVDFKKNTLTSDVKQFERLQMILRENKNLHSGTPTLGYFIAILKEIHLLNMTRIPDRKILVLLAQQEQITDNKAVTQFIERFDFIDVVTIKEAQHEILIEKEKIRHEALSLMNTFLKS